MSVYGTLRRHAAHYLGGRVLLLLLGFLSFPLLTRVFSVQQYGEIGLLLKSVVCLVVLAKMGVQNSVVRFFEESQTAGNQASQQRFYSTFFFGALSVAAAAAILLCASYHFLPAGLHLAELRIPLLCAALLVSIRAMWSITSSFFQAAGQTVTYNLLDIGVKAFSLAGIVAAFAWWGCTLSAFFSASLGAEAVVVAVAAALIAREGVLRVRSFDWHLFRMAILYGLPLAAYEISSIVLDSGDRFLVLHFLGTQQLGLYSAAYNLSAYTQVSVMAPINLAIIPIYMRLWRERGEGTTRDFLSRALDGFTVVAAGLFLAGSLVTGPLLVALASAKYEAAARLLPILIAAMLVYALHIFFTPGLLIYKRTGVLARQVAWSTVLNLGLNAVLLPRFGILGGAVATLLSYSFLVIVLAWNSYSLLPVRVDLLAVLFRVGVAGVLYAAASSWCPHSASHELAFSVAIATVCLLVYAALLGALDPTGRRWMRDAVVTCRTRAQFKRERHLHATLKA